MKTLREEKKSTDETDLLPWSCAEWTRLGVGDEVGLMFWDEDLRAEIGVRALKERGRRRWNYWTRLKQSHGACLRFAWTGGASSSFWFFSRCKFILHCKKKKKKHIETTFFSLGFLDLSHSQPPVCFRLKGVRKINTTPFGFYNSFFNLILKIFLGLRTL